MARHTHIVSEDSEVLGISRSNASTVFTEGALALVSLPGRRKPVAGATLERPLGMTEATTDEPITTTDRLNPTTDGRTSSTQVTPEKPSTPPERRTPTSNTRPLISTAGTCHPCGVASRDVAVGTC